MAGATTPEVGAPTYYCGHFSPKLQGIEKSWAGVWASLAPPFDPPMSVIGQEQSIQCRQINVLGLNWTEKESLSN